MSTLSTSRLIRFGHSPDADDAFMFYGLAKALVTIPGCRVEHVMQDIQSLNRRAIAQADLEVTAISAAVYPQVAQHYRIMVTGASMGRGYGPVLVSKHLSDPAQLAGHSIAIPGEHTTAFLLLRLYLGRLADQVQFQTVHFEQIPQAVLGGVAEAGLLIHEGQLTYDKLGLQRLVDLGLWWKQETNLPIPLGLDVVHRDLGKSLSLEINRALRQSIEAAYADEEAALDYALAFGRDVDRETCRTFVRRYVNGDTLDMGAEGQRALEALFGRAHGTGLLDQIPSLDIIDGMFSSR